MRQEGSQPSDALNILSLVNLNNQLSVKLSDGLETS